MIAWPTAALLAAIVVLEGARRVRAGDMAFRQLVAGSWTAAPLDAERRRWMLVSWLPPIWTTLVVTTAGAKPSVVPPPIADRLRAVRLWFLALSILGALVLVALIAGIPVAEARWSGVGVLLAIGVVLVLALITALVAAWARARLGLPQGPAWAALSPFAAPAAAERLLQEMLAPYSTLVVARALLPQATFRSWIRPRVYDAESEPDTQLRGFLDPGEVSAILAPPADGGDATMYCPRCGAVYRDGTGCSDCESVSLQRFPRNLPAGL